MKCQITRRHFVRRNLSAVIASTLFPAVVPATVFGKEGTPAPGDRIGLGCIGVGPQGRGDMGAFLAQNDTRVLAVCDVAKTNLELARQQVNQKYQNADCASFHDYRELLQRQDIDAVLIATPDHWHVPVALAAIRAGKDVYLEKPMGLSLAEDQLLRRTVQQRQRVFQFGTQQRSSKEFRQACELVRNGRIGKLQSINVWCSASRPGGSTQPATIPDGLDYDRWLGPAPATPYTVGKCFDVSVPGAWKTWWFNYDYALGFIAGWGVHPLDIAYWGHPKLMDGPLSIEGTAIIPTEGACNTGIAWDVRFKSSDGVTLQYRGTRNNFDTVNPMNDMTAWEQRYGQIPDHGTAFEGTDGWVVVYRGGVRTSPAKLIEEPLASPTVRLISSSNHARNFLDAIRSRGTTVCPIEDAVQADLLCHLSDIASRLGRKLTWDPAQERFVNDEAANQKLGLRPLRKGWEVL